MKKVHFVAWGFILTSSLVGCATPPPQPVSEGHIQERPKTPTNPPPLVRTLTPPPINPEERKRIETYSVVVKDVDIRDLLFSLARDAKVDVDISPEVTGSVTLNAVKQSLPQILERLSANFDMAYEVVDGTYRITKDKPVLRAYRVEYPNIVRTSNSETKLNALENGANTGSSKTDVTTTSKNEFWKTLIENVKDILRDTDKELILRKRESNSKAASNAAAETISESLGAIAGALSSVGKSVTANANASSTTATTATKANNGNVDKEDKDVQVLYAAQVIANPETGILQIRATPRQHSKIKEFLDLVLSSSQRQVLIEATVAEVALSQKYEKGIDWSVVRNIASGQAGLIGFGTGFRDAVNAINNGTTSSSPYPLNTNGLNTLELGLASKGSNYDFLSSIRLLEEFGNVKVLSSPKLSVLNNQSALLKVSDNIVYFDLQATVTQNSGQTTTSYSSTAKNVPVGFVMSVTPFIGNDGVVQLNLRPSISRIIGYATDPNPDLKRAGVTNTVPIIRSREMESIMRVSDGNIAVLGGLMEDYVSGDLGGIPGLTRNAAGEVLANRTDNRTKTELVIFIRPRVVRNADLSGDYNDFQRYLMNDSSFQAPHPALEQK